MIDESTERERLRTVPLTEEELDLIGEYAGWESHKEKPPTLWQERLLLEIKTYRDKYGELEAI